MICIVVAYCKNRVIGQNNDMPWHLPADLRHFKELTTGKTVVMGSKTFRSIVARLGKPLPNRRNIVLSRNSDFEARGAEVASSISSAVKSANGEDIFVIGGGEIFNLALPYVAKIYATEIDAELDGDVYFPALDSKIWRKNKSEYHEADEKNNYGYSFVTYERLI